jgi:hypothetical protein
MNSQSISRVSTVSFAVLLLVSASPAFAQSADPSRVERMAGEMQKRFAAADANGDGKLTKEEAKGKMPMVYKHFDEIDVSHSGAVTLADIAAYAKAKRAANKPPP